MSQSHPFFIWYHPFSSGTIPFHRIQFLFYLEEGENDSSLFIAYKFLFYPDEGEMSHPFLISTIPFHQKKFLFYPENQK